MNKKLLLFISIILLAPAISSAQLTQFDTGAPSITLPGLLNGITGAAWIIFTAIVVICFVVAGILFLTAQGDPNKLQTAKAAFLWGVAGVVVGIVAYSIIAIVLSIFY